MSKFGFMQTKLGTAGATAIQADSLPLAIADDNDRPGWKYVKDAGSGATDKFNWYFYAGTYESLKCKDVRSLFMCGSVDKWTNLSTEAPMFILYTKPKGDGSDQEAWYHSRHAWVLHMGSQLIRQGERCVFHCLEEPQDDFDGARKVALKTRIDTGDWNDNNEVLYCTLHSDSGAVEMKCLVEHMGMDCHSFSRLPKSTINIKCVV